MTRLAPLLGLGLGLGLAVAPLAASAETVVREGATLLSRIDYPETLMRFPRLAAFLRAEGEALTEEYRSVAAADAAKARAEGFKFRTYKLKVTHQPRFVSDRYASFLRVVVTDTGGAHPNTFLDPLTWDARKGDFVRLDAFFTPGAETGKGLVAVTRALRKILLARPGMRADDVKAATVPDVAVLQAFTLEPSSVKGRIGGLAFHFAPYEIAPYSAGPQRAVIPQAVLAPWLREDLARLFAGPPAP